MYVCNLRDYMDRMRCHWLRHWTWEVNKIAGSNIYHKQEITGD